MDITFLGAVHAIGGNKFLLTDGIDRESRILLDFGMQFGDPHSHREQHAERGGLGAMGAFFDEFLPPRAYTTLRDLIKLGILPAQEGIYRDDWAVQDEHRKAMRKHLGEDPLDAYWKTDLESYQAHKKRTGRPFVDGVLLSHAHADHFQHLAYLDPEIPVYCTQVTHSIVQTAGQVTQNQREVDESDIAVQRHLEEQGAKSAFRGTYKAVHHTHNQKIARRFIHVTPYEWFQVGAFKAQAIPIDHSVPGACFFLIEGKDNKRVLYTGDFRFHGVFEPQSAQARRVLAGSAPDAMLCEGTRIDSDHQDSERDVLTATKDTMSATKGLVLAEWGWKDATRFLTMQQAAKATGRTLVIDPRLAYMLDRLAPIDPMFKRVADYDNVQVYVRRKKTMTYAPGDYNKHELGYSHSWTKEDNNAVKRWFNDPEDGNIAPRALHHYVHGVRAPQIHADPDRYVLQTSYFQINELFDLDPPRGSYYIRSSCEPFNPEMESDVSKLHNWLDQWSIDSNIIENERGHHTSGHASGKELGEFWEQIKPRVLVPIHTEHPEKYEEWWSAGDIQPPKYGETIAI